MMPAMDSLKPATDAELLNALIRLMTPFRRIFQQTLDVNRFLVDGTYAKDIVDRLMSADDPRLLVAAEFLRGRLPGEGIAQQVSVPVVNSAAPVAQVTETPLPIPELVPQSSASQDLQAAKYVKRLR